MEVAPHNIRDLQFEPVRVIKIQIYANCMPNIPCSDCWFYVSGRRCCGSRSHGCTQLGPCHAYLDVPRSGQAPCRQYHDHQQSFVHLTSRVPTEDQILTCYTQLRPWLELPESEHLKAGLLQAMHRLTLWLYQSSAKAQQKAGNGCACDQGS